MTQPIEKPTQVVPSTTAGEAELAAWDDFSRDEQISRHQGSFRHPDCNTFTPDTASDIPDRRSAAIVTRSSN